MFLRPFHLTYWSRKCHIFLSHMPPAPAPKSLIRFHAWHEKYPKSPFKSTNSQRNHIYLKKQNHNNRHRASTSMYSLTFRVRVQHPAVWTKWNGLVADNVAHAAGASILSLARRVFAGMHSACGRPGGLPLGSATHFYMLPQQRNPCTDCKSVQ